MWRHLRAKRFEGRKWRRQHPIGPYVVDFVCPQAALVVELDGGQHGFEAQAAADAERTVFLEGLGY
ncbi:MAG: DUF559 domain-containing protein [Alphaproteobacteria bacterium]|nr:DUF559 domain-containing protein [Alphaproteobacteria bacterium]